MLGYLLEIIILYLSVYSLSTERHSELTAGQRIKNLKDANNNIRFPNMLCCYS